MPNFQRSLFDNVMVAMLPAIVSIFRLGRTLTSHDIQLARYERTHQQNAKTIEAYRRENATVAEILKRAPGNRVQRRNLTNLREGLLEALERAHRLEQENIELRRAIIANLDSAPEDDAQIGVIREQLKQTQLALANVQQKYDQLSDRAETANSTEQDANDREVIERLRRENAALRRKNARLLNFIKDKSNPSIAQLDLDDSDAGCDVIEIGEAETLANTTLPRADSLPLTAEQRIIEWNIAGALQVIPVPETLVEAKPWVDRYLADKLVLHPRAVRLCEKAIFEDVKLVYQTLLLLGDYRDVMVDGNFEKKRAFEDKLKELKLRLGRSIRKIQTERMRQDYHVDWNGASRSLEWAVKRGTAHDPRRSLRVYFFYDDNSKKVVIGSMPTHLRNQLS